MVLRYVLYIFRPLAVEAIYFFAMFSTYPIALTLDDYFLSILNKLSEVHTNF